jgi:hypothetical protein
MDIDGLVNDLKKMPAAPAPGNRPRATGKAPPPPAGRK